MFSLEYFYMYIENRNCFRKWTDSIGVYFVNKDQMFRN